MPVSDWKLKVTPFVSPKAPKHPLAALDFFPKRYIINHKMNTQRTIFAIMLVAALMLVGCASTDYTANMSGASDYATVAVKDFVTLGIVTVETTEIHYASPFSAIKRVEGKKVTYADLMQEAARLEADDIINIRIDVHTNYSGSAFDWLTGWTRVYTHTGTALAIKYTEKLDSRDVDPQLTGVPKAPEATKAVNVDRKTGKVQLR